MGRIFSEHVFSFKVFNSFSPQESRADKIRRMNEFIRKHGHKGDALRRKGFGDDVRGEVSSYHENDSGWDSFHSDDRESSRFAREKNNNE